MTSYLCLILILSSVCPGLLSQTEDLVPGQYSEAEMTDKIIQSMSRRFLASASEMECYPGHWPKSFCRMTNVFMPNGDPKFYVGLENATVLSETEEIADIWKLRLKSDWKNVNSVKKRSFRCDQIYDRGFVFSVYYYHGSNYFHVHYDTSIPLYLVFHYRQFAQLYQHKLGPLDTPLPFDILPSDPRHTVLLPGVESHRGGPIDWSTDAFYNTSTYWMEVLNTVGIPYLSLPLDERLIAMKKTMCFKEIYFGTPKVNFKSRHLIRSFTAFMKDKLGIPETSYRTQHSRPIVGIIHRDGRRRIENEKEIMEVISSIADVQLLEFNSMSFIEQISAVQRLTVLVGVNGAGLTNGLYLPDGAVVLQLIPDKIDVNDEEFGDILRERGPYLEATVTVVNDDNSTDVHVNPEEFLILIRKSLNVAELPAS